MSKMRDEIAAAVEEADLDGTSLVDEADEDRDSDLAASSEGQTGGDADDTSSESEDSDVTDEDVLDEYFGYKFPEGMEPKERLELVQEFRKRDDYIGKLLRDKEPESDDSTPDSDEANDPVVLTDSELLQALGLDPENNPFDEDTAKFVLPIVRAQIEQQGIIQALLENQELAELDSSWRKSLSGLEREFGPLPKGVDHDRVMEFAAETEVSSPVDAYWRIMGPGRSLVAKELETKEAKVAKATAAKKASTSTRPGTSTVDDDALPEATTTKLATREVARKLLTELGLDG